MQMLYHTDHTDKFSVHYALRDDPSNNFCMEAFTTSITLTRFVVQRGLWFRVRKLLDDKKKVVLKRPSLRLTRVRVDMFAFNFCRGTKDFSHFLHWEVLSLFSTSNNRASDKPHWLRYCHSAKLGLSWLYIIMCSQYYQMIQVQICMDVPYSCALPIDSWDWRISRTFHIDTFS